MEFYRDSDNRKKYIAAGIAVIIAATGIFFLVRDGEKDEDKGESVVERVTEKPTDEGEYVKISQSEAPVTLKGVVRGKVDKTSEIEFSVDVGGEEQGFVLKRGVVYFDGKSERVVGPNDAVIGVELTMYGRGDVKSREYDVEAVVLGDVGDMKYGVIESIKSDGKESTLKIAGLPEYVHLPAELEIKEGLSGSVLEFHNNMMKGQRIFYKRTPEIKQKPDGAVEYTASKAIIVD